MKKMLFRGSFFFLMTLLLVACGNMISLSGDTTQLTFSLGDDVAAAISSRQASAPEGDYRIVMSLTGGSSQTIEQSATEATLATVPFVFEGVPVGARIRASCSVYFEGVSIWSGSSDEIKVNSSTNRGVITLGRNSGIVVWDGTSLGIRPYGTASPDTLTLSYGEDNGQMPPFAFDNDKNLYYVDIHNKDLYKIPFDNGKYSKQNTLVTDDAIETGVLASSLCYDQVTGYLYGYSGNLLYGYRINDEQQSSIVGDGFSLGNITPEGSNDSVGVNPTAATVYNNRVYLYQCVTYDNTQSHYLIMGDINPNELTNKTALKLTLPHDGATVTDMMVQDGALYLLIRHVDFNSANPYSRGGIMKINLGDAPTLDTSFGGNGVYGLTSTVTTFKAGSTTINYTGGGTFLGPVKFVAVVPKKLVIADWGATVASGTSNATVSKKSRLVTVDLDTLSASVETVSDSGDYYNYSEAITPTGCYFK